MTDDERRARLARRHCLADEHRSDDPAAVTRSVVALHSSDPATVYLSVLARARRPSIQAVSTALYDDRTIVRHHGMRRTVWVTEPDLARAVQASTTAAIARKEWQGLAAAAERSGIPDPGRWIADISARVLDALHRSGPASARQLGKAVPELTRKITVGSGAYTVEVAAHTRVLLNLGFDGTIVRTAPTGSWTSSEYAWTAADAWLPGGLGGADPAASEIALVDAYVRRFGPVTTDDVRWWTGWTAAQVTRAISGAGCEAVSLQDGRAAWLAADDLGDVDPPEPWVTLLPSLDPTAMGWKERSWYLGSYTTFPCALFDRNGNVGPTVWLDGRVVGGWTQRTDGSVAVGLLQDLRAADRTRVDRAASQLAQLIAGSKVTPRFPTPLQKELAG